MTINSISAAYQTSAIQNSPAPKPQPAQSQPALLQPKDSVHLSAAAQAALGDADHDGDSK